MTPDPLFPIPEGAYDAATTALDQWATPPYGDLRLNAARAATVAVNAAAPVIQRDYANRIVGGQLRHFIAISLLAALIPCALATIAVAAAGWVAWLAAAALAVNVLLFISSRRSQTRLRRDAQASLLPVGGPALVEDPPAATRLRATTHQNQSGG